MGEAHDDHIGRVRVKKLVARTAVAAMELAVLVSVFDDITKTAQLLEEGVPEEELAGIPDPDTLFAKEEDLTTLEAFNTLRDLLGMSPEGQARLWSILTLNADDIGQP